MEYERAAELLADTAPKYAAAGDIEKYRRVTHVLANIKLRNGDVRGARQIYEELLADGEAEGDLVWIARESNTVGRCALELGETESARRHFARSVETFRQLGLTTEALHPQWGLGLAALFDGDAKGALSTLSALRTEFHSHGVAHDEALISLDIMDALLALSMTNEIRSLAKELVERFLDLGMVAGALAAFGYLKEAAESGHVTSETTSYVRRFLGRLEVERGAAFAPPPEKI